MIRSVSIFTLSLLAMVSLVEAKKFSIAELAGMPLDEREAALRKRLGELNSVNHKDKARNPDFLTAHNNRKAAVQMALRRWDDRINASCLYEIAQKAINALKLPTKRERAKNHTRSAFVKKLATQAIDNNLSIEDVMIQQKVEPAKIIELKRSGDFLWIREQLAAEKKLSLKKEGAQKFNIIELLDMSPADRMASLMKRKEELNKVDHKKKTENNEFFGAHKTRKLAIEIAMEGDFDTGMQLYLDAQLAIDKLRLPTKRERTKNHTPSDFAKSIARQGVNKNLSIEEVSKEYLYPFEIDEFKRSGDFLWIREELEAAQKWKTSRGSFSVEGKKEEVRPKASNKEAYPAPQLTADMGATSSVVPETKKGKEKEKEIEKEADKGTETEPEQETGEKRLPSKKEILTKDRHQLDELPERAPSVTGLIWTWSEFLEQIYLRNYMFGDDREWKYFTATQYFNVIQLGAFLEELRGFSIESAKVIALNSTAIEIKEKYEEKDLSPEQIVTNQHFVEFAKKNPELIGRYAMCYKLEGIDVPLFLVKEGPTIRQSK